MALIPRELDDAGRPKLTYKSTLENLVRALSNAFAGGKVEPVVTHVR